MFRCSCSDVFQTADMAYRTLPSRQVRKHDYCITVPCPEPSVCEVVSLRSHVHDTGIPNKLLLLKVNCYTHNETSEHSETHRASRNPIRTKTNIWSCKLSLHHHPLPDPHFSLKHFLMTEQTNPNIFSVWILGGRLVIVSLPCFSMSGFGGGGVQMRGGGFCWKHNWHGPSDTVHQIVLCLAVCIHRAPAMFH